MENKMDYTSEELMDNITETELEPWMKLTDEGWDVPVGEIKEMATVIGGLDTDFRVFIPKNVTDKMPLFFYIHGGAYVGGFNVMDEPVCRQVCNEVGCVVVSPNYGLAPQYQYPSQIEQLYGLFKYIVVNASDFHVDTNRIAIGGSSAGGNFAAVLCQLANERKEFEIKYQALVYPNVDLSDDLVKYQAAAEVGSENSFGEVDMEHPDAYQKLFSQYAPVGTDVKDPHISPLYADPKTFPKTSIFSGRLDLLWYEANEFARKLQRAGVEILYKSYANVGHGFMELKGAEDISRDVKNIICAELKRNL